MSNKSQHNGAEGRIRTHVHVCFDIFQTTEPFRNVLQEGVCEVSM